MRATRPIWDRFWEKVTVLDPACASPCFIWSGGKNQGGYGIFWADGRLVVAHVWAYEQMAGPVPAGLQLDHFFCDTTSCANWDHVRPVTHRENTLRGDGMASRWASRDRCDRGHEFTEANTHIKKDGSRMCRECHRERQALYRRLDGDRVRARERRAAARRRDAMDRDKRG